MAQSEPANVDVPKPNGNSGQTVHVITQQQVEMQLEQLIGPAFSCMLRGVTASFPQLPPHLIMLVGCMVMGKLVGMTYAGMNAPLAPLLKARADCKKAFDQAIASVNINSPGGMQSQPPAPVTPPPKL